MDKHLLLTLAVCIFLFFNLQPLYTQQYLSQVTYETEGVADFVWSPDGSQLAYIALTDDTTRLYLIDADGTNKIRLTSSEAYASIDWKGSVITFGGREGTGTYSGLIKRIAPDGSDEATIVGPYWLRSAMLRADAEWILYTDAPGGWWQARRCDLNGQNNLVLETYQLVQQVGWFGKNNILYTRGPNYNTVCGLHMIDFNGGGHVQLTTETLPNNALFTGSPDTSKILYCDGSPGNWSIWIMDADGSNQTQLTSDTTHDYLANTRDNIWTEDGQAFYFVSDRSGQSDIYKLNIDGSGLERITAHDSLDYLPIPSPDKTRLAFISRRDGVNNIWLLSEQPPPEKPQILSVSPVQNQLNVPVDENISVTFDMEMNNQTINDTTFMVHTSTGGLVQGTIGYDSNSRTATFDPVNSFRIGEVITVILTDDIQSIEGGSLTSSYSWTFTTVVKSGQGIFVLDSVYHYGDSPHGVYAADFDNDSDLDLATAYHGSDHINILLNDGNAAFSSDSVYSVNDPWRVIAADLNGDGNMDLASANAFAGQLSVLMNMGDAAFGDQTVYAVGGFPSTVFASDLDGDGDLDLAGATGMSNNIAILLNDGDGDFVIDSLYAAGSDPRGIYAADLDSDGLMDLAVATAGSYDVRVFLNTGGGIFAPDSAYPIGDEMRTIYAADVDGDTDMDLITANVWYDNISVLLNQGDGTFAPPATFSTGGTDPVCLAAADFNADGHLDIGTANAQSDDVSILLNQGDGSFLSSFLCPAGNHAFSIAAADFDDDGDLDIATANAWSNDISILLNSVVLQAAAVNPAQNALNVPADGGISIEFNQELDHATVSDTAIVVHSKSEGRQSGTISYDNAAKTIHFEPAEAFNAGDVVTVTLTTDIHSAQGMPLSQPFMWSFTVEVPAGEGQFAAHSTYQVGANPVSVCAADINEDNHQDLVIANMGSNNISVLFSRGDGTFDPAIFMVAGAMPRSVIAADLNNDSHIDMIAANSASDSLSVFFNDGSYGFNQYLVDISGQQPTSVFSADFNGDGFSDLATANILSDNISVLLNNGDGTFGPDSLFAVSDPRFVYACDIDNDGDMDITTANNVAGNVSVLLNDGVGTFTPDSNYAVNSPFSLFPADFNHDGWLDLATANYSNNTAAVLLNNRNGILGSRTYYPVGNYATSVVSSDFDGDGDLDLVATNNVSQDISVLLNNGDATFAAQEKYTVAGPYAVCCADFDGDGDMDLAVTNYDQNTVTIMLNQDVTGIATGLNQIPDKFRLYQNYPNPFNPVTTIKYDLPEQTRVTLKVYNILGQEVMTLVDRIEEAGFKYIQFDATHITSGIYIYKIKAGMYTAGKKLLLIK